MIYEYMQLNECMALLQKGEIKAIKKYGTPGLFLLYHYSEF